MYQHIRCLLNVLKIVVPVLFFSSMVFATADGPDYLDVRAIAANEELTIHLKPADSSEIIGKVPYNATCLKNLGCTGDSDRWCKIDYQGAIGWVNGEFIQESGDCPSPPESDDQKGVPITSSENFTKQMLDGKNLFVQNKDGGVKLSFVKSNPETIDGTIVFTFLTPKNCHPGTIERLNYRLKSGKIIYYANDGSKTRLTLQEIHATSWAVLEEEDVDGDGDKFDFGQPVKKVYEFENRCGGARLDP